jgi:hypothetical protein
MGAITAASTYRESMGSLTLHIFNFSAISGDDTFASGLGTSVVGFWCTDTMAVGSTVNAAGMNVSNSSGTFTFAPALAASTGTLYVVARN